MMIIGWEAFLVMMVVAYVPVVAMVERIVGRVTRTEKKGTAPICIGMRSTGTAPICIGMRSTGTDEIKERLTPREDDRTERADRADQIEERLTPRGKKKRGRR